MLHLSAVLDHEHPSSERQAFDQKWLGVILRNGDRHPRIALDIRVFLAAPPNEAVKYETFIGIPDHGSLGPAIGAVRCNCHNAVCIEESDNLFLELNIHKEATSNGLKDADRFTTRAGVHLDSDQIRLM